MVLGGLKVRRRQERFRGMRRRWGNRGLAWEVSARGGAGPATELGEERGRGDAALEAVEHAAAEEVVEAGQRTCDLKNKST